MVEEATLQMNLEIEAEDGDPYEQARATYQLRDEIKMLGAEGIVLVVQASPDEDQRTIDPMLAGAVIATVMPIVLPKFLEFLHAWVIRREALTVKISIKTQKGDAIDIEVPYTMSPTEVKQWIATIQDTFSKRKP